MGLRNGVGAVGRRFCSHAGRDEAGYAFGQIKRWPLDAGLTAAAGLGIAVYILPMFGETRKGLYLAWNYPYADLYQGSASEMGWKIFVGGSGLFAGMFSVRAITMTKGGVFNTWLSAFAGVLTGKFCFDQSGNIVSAAHRVSKALSYGMDGFIADVVGRDNERMPVWERVDGLTVDVVAEYLAARQKEATNEVERNKLHESAGVSNMKDLDLAAIESKIDSGQVANEILDDLKKRHKELLIKEITSLRQEQRRLERQLGEKMQIKSVMKSEQSLQRWKDDVQNTRDRLDTIDRRKAELKEKSLAYHDLKLTAVCNEELQVMIWRLSELRMSQYDLMSDAKISGGSSRLLLQREARKMDAEKHKLKMDAKTLFGVNISGRAKSAPSWKAE